MSKRNYPLKPIKYWYAYTIEEVCDLYKQYKTHPQTVREWIKRGLKTIDKSKPTLIYGYDLHQFLGQQNSEGKHKTNIDEMFCFTCQDVRKPYKGTVEAIQRGYSVNLKAVCSCCKGLMNKGCNLEDFAKVKKIFTVGDVSQLYDILHSPCNTHLKDQDKPPLNESPQMEFIL